MQLDLLLVNLTSPPLLFFALGALATLVKSDLEFPAPLPKLFSLYLLFAIGFKGGAGLAATPPTWEAGIVLLAAVIASFLVPIYTFYMIRGAFRPADAAAVAATYGSVSAVTFITAASFLESIEVSYGGHMVAALALMESPAIIVGILLAQRYCLEQKGEGASLDLKSLLHEALCNGSVFLLLGSLVVGWMSSEAGREAVQPLTSGVFYGALCFFLLDMGIVSSQRLGALKKNAKAAVIVGLGLPLLNAALAIVFCRFMQVPLGDALLLVVLIASASYIAVPATLRHAVPEANPGLYLPMSLAITFPLNISIGIPLYYYLLGGMAG